MKNRDRDYHFFATDFTLDRVKCDHLACQDHVIESVDVDSFTLKADEIETFMGSLKILLGREMMKIDGFKWMESITPQHIPHPLQEEMSQHSKIFILPVSLNNEASYSDCIKIMDECESNLNRWYTKFGRVLDLEQLFVPFGGDQLTRVRLQGAKSLRAGAHSASQRFDHLHPVIIEMFHTLQDFLEKLCKKFLNLSCGRDVGTLPNLKILIERANVNGNVKSRFKIEKSTRLVRPVSMDTKDGSELHSQPSHYVVEEEYTVGVPLVRPKPAFLEVLRLAGATGEVFTKKEICSYLKEYIGSRQLYDVHDPRVVHCGHDRLGEVFRVDSFTINDVLDLLSKHCNQVPDTCLKRKRHLVTKPFPPPVSTHMQPGSLRIAVCRAIPQTLSPVITSTCSHRKSSTNCLPSSSVKSRKSSSSSSETKKSSKESSIGCADNTGDQATVPSLDGEFSAEKRRAKRKKRRNDDSTSEGSSKKQHFSEPNSGGQGMPGTSRRRGTSLSIMYGDDGDKNMFPWYFEVEVGDSNHDDDDKSEVLSLQGKETATVHDSTDDLWFLEEDSIAVEVNSDAEFSVEYDVESDISSIVESDISSVRSGEGLLVVCKESDVEFFADYSDSDSNSGDKELTEADNWICLECRHKNLPLQRYCDRCWKLRADWLPGQQSSLSEPRKQNGSTKLCNESLVKDIENDFKDSGVGSLSSTQPSSQEAADISLSNEAMFYKNTRIKTLDAPTLKDFSLNQRSLIEESQSSDTRHSFSNYQQKNKSSSPLESSESKVTGYNLTTEGQVQDLKVPKTPLDDPCMICLTKPKTASLIHGSSGHQVCCFSCAKRLKRRGKVCPVCRRPIQKVIKNYIL